ncbi:hypothetical protein [Streptomyces sp. NPDC021212]|uniref:hypothetical protein n=1 Tax=Streptomyces sp. NPDC021212 TaxID=3365118 RepID=UPI00379D000C
MAGRQLPAAIEEFASYLRALTRRIDPEQGWYAVFAQRDPEGLRACLDGLEIPPWDVVQALLQDLSAQRGARTANVAAARAATLYRASITTHDAAPGTREALLTRLAAMHREQFAAADRERDLLAAQRAGAETTPDGDPVDAALAWAQDDHHRATARCEELTARLAALPAPTGESASAQGAADPLDPPPVPWAAGGPQDPSAERPQPGGARPGPPGAGPLPGAAGGHPAPGQGAPSGPAWQPPLADAGGGQGPAATGPRGVPSGGGPAGPPAPGAQAGGAPPPAGQWGEGEAGPRIPGVGPSMRAQGPPPRAEGPSPRAEGPPPRAEEPPPRDEGPPSGPAGSSRAASGLRNPSASGLAAPRGARFAASYEGDPDPAPPASPAAEPLSRPRGARFPGVRGGARKREREAEERARAISERQELAEARKAAGEAVARLGRLRAEGRSGEAHAVLCETAVWPAGRLPVLATELERAGLGADVATLLWEMSSLPPEQLSAAAQALIAAGREPDGERLLRQSVAQPVAEVARTALALLGNGGYREVLLLLTAFIQARTAAEVAEAAAEDPGALVPLLLDAASAMSPGSQHDLAHALRMAGIQS